MKLPDAKILCEAPPLENRQAGVNERGEEMIGEGIWMNKTVTKKNYLIQKTNHEKGRGCVTGVAFPRKGRAGRKNKALVYGSPHKLEEGHCENEHHKHQLIHEGSRRIYKTHKAGGNWNVPKMLITLFPGGHKGEEACNQ